MYGRLAQVDLTQEQGLHILQNLASTKVFSEKVRENVARIWNEPTHEEDSDRNLYNLNNAVTQYFTHEQNSIEYAQRSSKKVLELFEKTAHSGTEGKTFKTLTKNEEITVTE